jgi:hypothetical protein
MHLVRRITAIIALHRETLWGLRLYNVAAAAAAKDGFTGGVVI